MKKIIFLLALSIFSVDAYSQNKRKFGQVTKNELEMQFYDKDSSANAVILFDYGRFDGQDFKFKRHLVIKILTKEGTSWGNWTLRTPNKSSFRAKVFNLDNGEVVSEKVGKTSIFEEELVDGITQYKLFIPNVKVGSVIDLEYSFVGLPYEWRFQDLIPVAYSELKIEKNQYIVFSRRHFGFHSIQSVGTDHWIAKDVPGFGKEPFLNHYSNYLTKIEFELQSIAVPGVYYKDYNTTWQQVSKVLTQHSRFGDAIKGCPFLKEKAKEIVAAELDEKEKIARAYAYIQDNMSWDKNKNIFVSLEFRENFLKKHVGNTAEINLALVSLLKKVGLQAWPVVLSTRENGLVMPFQVSLDKLNYVVAAVYQDEQLVLLDATSKRLAPGILPERCLNGQGWLVDNHDGRWVDLVGNNLSKQQSFIQISVDENSEWVAQLGRTFSQYEYLRWAEIHEELDTEEKFVRNLVDTYPNLQVEEYEVAKDSKSSLYSSEKMKLNLNDYIDDLGDELILNPFILNELNTNPFKSENRRYPVDLGKPMDLSSTITIKLPENYQVKSLPESANISMPEKSAVFLYSCTAVGKDIRIQFRLRINKTVFHEGEYLTLRQFYSIIVDKMSESIQMTKDV
ncbi:transglutaminase domain-containing protein [Reichenbachiella sp.]|uniref:transglutaminase domain-containing protein n=1 Tax=Reichenbachiella sp. TaxID=2184521 RepID=UPI003296A77C